VQQLTSSTAAWIHVTAENRNRFAGNVLGSSRSLGSRHSGRTRIGAGDFFEITPEKSEISVRFSAPISIAYIEAVFPPVKSGDSPLWIATRENPSGPHVSARVNAL
jgi:hypothetical protein